MEIGKKVHIGDGVYVENDGYHIILTANVPTTDTIYLDFYTQVALRKLLEQETIVQSDSINHHSCGEDG